MRTDEHYCPICYEYIPAETMYRFGMCLDCFLDRLTEDVRGGILSDFISDYREELGRYVEEYYND